MKFLSTVASLSLLAGLSQASVLTFQYADYDVYTRAIAHTDTQTDSDTGTSSFLSWSDSRQSSAVFDDPDLGTHTASGSASAYYSYADNGGTSSFSGGVGGVAESVSFGLDTYADAYATLEIYFTANVSVTAATSSEGTYNSDLYRWNGSAWDPFYVGLNGPDTVILTPGEYKWYSAAGSSTSGYNYYSAGINFSMDAQAVPEPASIAVVAGGVALAARRKRKG